jgi:hypothetical protein
MRHLYLILTALPVLFFSACETSMDVELEPLCGDLAPVQYEDLTICVTHDYYSENGVRIPLDLPDSLELADQLDMMLPTTGMVDAIWEQADIQLPPIPMPPGPEMTSEAYFVRHDQLIDQQLRELGHEETDGLLIAGHKKDVIDINPNSTRVAIYGWHRTNGQPIQPYSTVHGSYYYDYSHGIRLVSRIAFMNDGTPVDLREL